MKNLIIRTLSGILFVIVVVFCLGYSKFSFLALIIMIGIGSMFEFFRLAKKTGAQPMVRLSILFGVLIILLFFAEQIAINCETRVWSWILIIRDVVPIVALAVPFVVELYRKREKPITNIATTLMGYVYIILPMVLMIKLVFSPTGSYIPDLLFSIFLIVWANDVGAYVVGVSLGRHRLMERISPKKSWEGFFGGFIAAIVMAMVVAHFISDSGYVWFAILGAVVAVSGVFGDLVESMFKREAEVKDSGRILPGHGGFLDRFDAILLALPFVYVFIELVDFTELIHGF